MNMETSRKKIDCSAARLRFLSDWRVTQLGNITPGKELIIEYDGTRLPNYRRSFRELELWNIEVYVRFHPGSQLHKGSLLEELRAGNIGPVVGHIPAPFRIVVPSDAAKIEIWFR